MLSTEIDRAAGTLYRDGHYANAVEDAVKALNALVRLRSGVDDLDGSKLMERVFSPQKPVLNQYSPLTSESRCGGLIPAICSVAPPPHEIRREIARQRRAAAPRTLHGGPQVAHDENVLFGLVIAENYIAFRDFCVD